MGNILLPEGFCPAGKQDKYLIAEVHTNNNTVSKQINDGWDNGFFFILEGFKSLKKEPLTSTEIDTINTDLSARGWIERTYASCGVIRGVIRPVKELQINVLYDHLNTYIKAKVLIKPDTKIEDWISYITDTLTTFQVTIEITQDMITVLEQNYRFSRIVNDSYLNLELVFVP